MKTALIKYLIVVAGIVNAQWITSTAPESSLFTCPGFEPGVVTHPDGSSIISGYLEDWIYAQKFDKNGNKLWPQYLVVHQNDSSDFCINTRVYSDGNGGAIFLWQDARPKYKFGNTDGIQLIAQRIDNDGQRLWGNEGIVISKYFRTIIRYNICPMNNNDVIILTEETDTGYVGASQQQRLRAFQSAKPAVLIG